MAWLRRIARAAVAAAAAALAFGAAPAALAQDGASVAAAPTIAGAAASGGALRPAGFVDRFDPATFDRRWYLSEHADTGEWLAVEWRRSQVELGSHGAVISLAPAPEGGARPYMSGEIVSRETYLYGYFEARMRIPRGNGMVAAFFTFTRPDGEESWNEIDIEFTARDPRRLELVYHVAGDAHLQVLALPFDASAGYHTYAFEWMPDQIRWYIDNRLVHISRGGRVAELNRPQQVFASLWNSVRMPR